MTEKKIQEAIKKYSLSLTTKDGQDAIRVSKPPRSMKIQEELKATKPEIIAELKRQRAERDAQNAVREAEYARKQEEYAKTADLRRCLLCKEDEHYNRTWGIGTLVFVWKKEIYPEEKDVLRAFEPEYRKLMKYTALKHVTPTMNVAVGNGVPYGLYGVAWEITPEQESQMVAEQGPVQVEADRLAAEEKAAKEAAAAAKKAQQKAELQSKFDEAKSTGKPVVIRRYTVPCCDSNEECNMDIVLEYAMPDGSTKSEQHHTW